MQRSFLLVVVAYGVALAAAFASAAAAPLTHPIAIALAADVAATVVIFAFSYAFGNSSFYDPYWSVAPLPMAMYWAAWAHSPSIVRQVLVIGVVAIWGARLTYNWARGWQGLQHEDWRYVDLRVRSRDRYWLVSFAGIHMFPTVVVFLGCLSIWVAVTGSRPFGALDVLATIVTGAAVWIEATADRELHRFRSGAREPGEILDRGLWALSRHPNYFGEMTFWWGLWLFAVAAAPQTWWWTAIGPAIITLMFRFVSLPMMEERMHKRRAAYAVHARKTSLVIPWPPRTRA